MSSSKLHRVADRETLWFLGQLYYGRGEHLDQIVEANPELKKRALRVGEALIIPDPRFWVDGVHTSSQQFQERYDHLVQVRSERLKAKRVSSNAARPSPDSTSPDPIREPSREPSSEKSKLAETPKSASSRSHSTSHSIKKHSKPSSPTAPKISVSDSPVEMDPQLKIHHPSPNFPSTTNSVRRQASQELETQ